LAAFEQVFAVVLDNDAQKLKELGFDAGQDGASDAWVEGKVTERQAARQRRDFATSDEIRKELADRGIIIEDSKDGNVRWKRK
jgi:cysteinyl-tRNA synthetase